MVGEPATRVVTQTWETSVGVRADMGGGGGRVDEVDGLSVSVISPSAFFLSNALNTILPLAASNVTHKVYMGVVWGGDARSPTKVV